MKRNFKVFGIFTLLVLFLASCGTPATVATTAPAAGPTQVTTGIDCMGSKSGDSLSLVYQWTGNEQNLFNITIQPFLAACGIDITSTSTRDDAVLDTMVKSVPPDVAFWPNFSPLKLYAAKLQPMNTTGVVVANYPSYWNSIGSSGGKLLTLPFKADVKSIIWYSPTQFKALGYTVPTTLDELTTLVNKMVTDGNIPWSMGFESGSATGWTGSDFIQDLLLATQGPDYVNGIIAGTTPYNDPGVKAAYETYFKWASDPKYTIGGATGTVSTAFADAILKVFSNPPEALMVKQSGFAGSNIVAAYPNLKYGVDFDFFEFPGVKGIQGGGDFIYVFNVTPAAQALLNYLTTMPGVVNFAQTGWGISPNTLVKGAYIDAQISKLSDILAATSGFTFDIGDALGAPFNTAEWTAIVNVVQGQDIQTNLNTAAAAQTASVK